MKTTSRTQLERLRDWIGTVGTPLDFKHPEGYWVSPPLPTRRFGPNAWASFSMRLSPDLPTLGPFKAWIVFHSAKPELQAYLEQPLAGAFGVVESLPRPASNLIQMPSALVEALGQAGERFFAEETASPEDAAMLSDLEEWLSEGLFEAMNEVVAPDFFSWLAISAAMVDSGEQSTES